MNKYIVKTMFNFKLLFLAEKESSFTGESNIATNMLMDFDERTTRTTFSKHY